LAEVQSAQVDPVAGLIDIPLPQPVSLLPQTWPSRIAIALLAGPAWLAFLDSTYDGSEFSEGPGRLLASAPYQRTAPGGGEVRPLAALVRRWIRGHHA
jgi:Ca-activated chloride channel family protein